MKKRGMTLTELLIVMSLLAVVMPIVISMFVTSIKTLATEMAQTRLQADAQTILDVILNDAKNAQSVDDILTVDATTYTTGTNSIVLNVPAIDNSQVIQYNADGQMLFDKIIYYYENNKIHKFVFADPSSYRYGANGDDKILASNILVLSFNYDPDAFTPTLVSATVTNSELVANRQKAVTVTGKARFRNHI